MVSTGAGGVASFAEFVVAAGIGYTASTGVLSGVSRDDAYGGEGGSTCTSF